jgi:predicted nucleic acid-binding protein
MIQRSSDLYVDTSYIAASMIGGSPNHRDASVHAYRSAESGCRVYFSQLTRIELLQAIRVIGTDPEALPEVMRRRYRLARWGWDEGVRERWMAYGVAQFRAFLDLFDAAVEIPLTITAWETSISLMTRYHLKSYDAFHAATAIELGVYDFATADTQFSAVAELNVHLIRNPAPP